MKTLSLFAIACSVLALNACSKPATSKATIRFQVTSSASAAPNAAAKVGDAAYTAALTPAPATTPTPWDFAERAIDKKEEVTCYAVLITAEDNYSPANACVLSDGQKFAFDSAVGFVGAQGAIEVEVPVGKRQRIQVVATAVAAGEPCPSVQALNLRRIAQLREVGQTAAEIRAGENVIDMRLSVSGPTISSCEGAAIRPIARNLDCNRAPFIEANEVGDHAIVLLKPGASMTAYMSQMSSGLNVQHLASWEPISSHMVRFDRGGRSLRENFRALCESDLVSFVEPVGNRIPTTQFNRSINSSDAGFSKPVVAQLDTGVDTMHSTLNGVGALLVHETGGAAGVDDDGNGLMDDGFGWNFITNSGSVTDDDGHGTAMTGLVLTGAGVDITLAMPPTSPIGVIPMKVLDNQGNGIQPDAVTAVLYAIEQKASVISFGFGFKRESLMLKRALVLASSYDILIVTPAGNETANIDDAPMYPASWRLGFGIGVGAHNDFGTYATFSNFGSASVHLAAPGVSQLTTLPGNTFGRTSGTSIASAQLAGAAAKIKATYPSLTMLKIREILLHSATKVPLLLVKTGAGKLNLPAALAEASSEADLGHTGAAWPLLFYPQ